MRSTELILSLLIGVSAVSLIVATVGTPESPVRTEQSVESKDPSFSLLKEGQSNVEQSTLTIEDAIFMPEDSLNSTTTSAPDGNANATVSAQEQDAAEDEDDDEEEEDDDDDDEENPEGEDEIIVDTTSNHTSTIEPAKVFSLGDVPVAAQIDGDVDEETIATVLHFLKEMDENDDVAAAAVEGSGDDNTQREDLSAQQEQNPSRPSASDEPNTMTNNEEEDEETPLFAEEEEDDFDTGRDDPYAWENEVPNPDRIPGGPGYYVHHNFEDEPVVDTDDIMLRGRHGASRGSNINNGAAHSGRRLAMPTRFEMLRHEVLAHGPRAPSRLLNDFPVFAQEGDRSDTADDAGDSTSTNINDNDNNRAINPASV